MFLLGLTFLSFFSQSCTSVKQASNANSQATEANSAAVLSVRQWLVGQSKAARSINVSGNISVDQDGSSQSASFDLKAKRLNETGDRRVDSLSVVVSGPFGIKVARFLASPEKYSFFDILHGETVSGETDQESLSHLTQLRGLSLPMVTDLVFGLVPAGDDLLPEDSVLLFERSSIQTLVVYRAHDQVTDAIELAGSLPQTGNVAPAALSVRRFRRWNGYVTDPLNTQRVPDVTINMSDHTLENGVLVPHHIEANAGKNTLQLEYTDVLVNPSSLTVRIKMP
jgi:hypothetical protein